MMNCQRANLQQSVAALHPYVDERLSYVYGRSAKQLKYSTCSQVIGNVIRSEPHATAVVVLDEGITKNFSELQTDLDRLINGMLQELHLRRGDRVALYSYNCYQFVLIQLAASALGLVLCPLNPSFKAQELAYVLADVNVKALFAPGKNSRQSHLNDHHAVVCDDAIRELQQAGKLSNLTHVVLLDGQLEEDDLGLKGVQVSSWQQVCADRTPNVDSSGLIDSVQADDLYGIYFTSGTTGVPKGATLTQFNVINNASLALSRIFDQRDSSARLIACCPLPLFHEFAGLLGTMLPFCSDNGGTIVLTGARYSVQSVVEAIRRYKCNTLFLTPTILIDLIAFVDRSEDDAATSLSTLKQLIIGGAKVAPELIQKAHKSLPDLVEVRIGYGTSENGVIATVQSSLEPAETRTTSVGWPLEFTELRIVDVETGETTVPLGQLGEIQTRGFNIMVGYYGDEKRTKETITGSRWYRTGDLGVLDRNGSVCIAGRIKDLIIKGGENVHPVEIETVLHRHHLIQDAHVCGVPDERFGEEICAWIKLDKTECALEADDVVKEQILAHCAQKLAYFKVPKYVLFVEEFPLTAAKKVKKFEMRATTIQKLNLNGN